MTMTRVKICGITNPVDADVAVEAGADLLGFILYQRSPRSVAVEDAARIIETLPETVQCVGVFVNAMPKEIRRIMAGAGFDYAQLHGHETPESVQAFSGRAYKALRPENSGQAQAQAAAYGLLGVSPGPALLIDAYDAGAYGGTGKKADWQTAAKLARRFPGLLLAGGLTPENVAAAVATVNPWGVDVASGVEISPGRKDHAAVRRFVRHAKDAAPVA